MTLPEQRVPLTRKQLEERIKTLENELKTIQEKKWHDYVDEFVDKWYEDNKDQVDIGNVYVGPFKVDLMPDTLEKNIYKKTIKIMFSLFRDATSQP